MDLHTSTRSEQSVHSYLTKVWSVDDRTLKEISAGTFSYAGLFLIEGTGLLFRKRWASYFTIIVTASFLPFEIYEIVHEASILKAAVIGVNVAYNRPVPAHARPAVLDPASFMVCNCEQLYISILANYTFSGEGQMNHGARKPFDRVGATLLKGETLKSCNRTNGQPLRETE
jgi:hypothetical protein